MRRASITLLVSFFGAATLSLPLAVRAEDAPAAVTPAPVAAPAAPAQSGTSVLRRTPALDGAIDPGEWDPVYQVQDPDFSATAYADWDEGRLYVGFQSNKPTDLMVTIDANSDGWFHGSDNYILKAVNTPEKSTAITLAKYDSKAKMDTPGATVPVDVSGLSYKSSLKEDSNVVEIAIPVDVIEGLKLGVGKKLGMRMALRPSVEGAPWKPMAVLGDVEPCVLSNRKAVATDQMDMSIELRDYKVVSGQTLEAKLFLKNTSTQPLPVDCFVIGGDGRAAKFLNSAKIRVEGLAGGATAKHKFETRIPSDMPTGSWALGAEARSETGRMGAALASFEVVKPYEITMNVGDDPLILGSKSETTVRVKMKNNAPDRALGEMIITLPEGWRLKPNLRVRKFEISGEDRSEEVKFRIVPPVGVAPGDATVKVDVKINGETFSLGKNLTVVAPEAGG